MTGTRLEGRLAELEKRLGAVEKRLARDGPIRRAKDPGGPLLAALDALAGRALPRFAREGRSGALAYAGAARFGEAQYRWAREHGLPDLMDAEWPNASKVLECLGSPSRLALLKTLLGGPRDRQSLQDTLGDASTGQLYHHLRDLQAVGLLVQKKRGEYQIAAETVVPLLTIVASALDLGTRGNSSQTEVSR